MPALRFAARAGLLREMQAGLAGQRGVDQLSETPSDWSLVPADAMNGLIAEAKAKGWKRAIKESADIDIQSLYDFTDSPARVDGTFYLPLNKESRVLDLGSGLGSYTFALAPRVGQVVAADSNFDSLRFISLRAGQDKQANVSAVQIEPLDRGRLPFGGASFDAVIMNGVLEWVGSYLKEGDPLQLQRRCLQEVKRILRPGGAAWIGIENRFGLRYLLGAPDDHLSYYNKDKKIAYTTLMPRILASLVTGRQLGRPYRTYTHSLWGYRRLLASAGFQQLEFFYPENDYRAISTKIYPLDSQEVILNIRQRMSVNKWLGLLSLFKLERALCDSYFIIAGREE